MIPNSSSQSVKIPPHFSCMFSINNLFSLL